MGDDMPDSLERRRWDDVVQEIKRNVDASVPPAVSQAMTPYRLVVDETARDVTQLKTVVFGAPTIGVRGMVERMGAVEGKLDTLLDVQTKREEDWKNVRAFLDKEHDRQATMKGVRTMLTYVVAPLGVLATIATIINALINWGVIRP